MSSATFAKTDAGFEVSFYINPKLEQHFPNDPFSDITIIFANKNYKLQKAYLRLESDYFAENFEAENVCKNGLLLIGKKFDVSLFDKILRCFYGAKACIFANEIYNVLEICSYLKCASLLAQILEQIAQNFENLNFFLVYSIAYLYSSDNLLQKCFHFLKDTNFQVLLQEWVYSSKPANKYPTTIYSLAEESFKNLIKMHNQAKMRGSYGSGLLNYCEVYQVLKNYVGHNFAKAEQMLKLKEITTELIDKNQLNSKEYKAIYHQDLFLAEEEKSCNNSEFPNKSLKNDNKTADSAKIDVIASENFLFRKEMEELRSENAVLLEELKVLKDNFQKSQLYLLQYEEKYCDLSTRFQEIRNDFNNNYIKNEMRFYENELTLDELRQEIASLSKNQQETATFRRTFSEKTSHYCNKLKRNSAVSQSESKNSKKTATIMKQVLKTSEIDEEILNSESFAKKAKKTAETVPTYSILQQIPCENAKEDVAKFIKKLDDNSNKSKNLQNLMKNICIDPAKIEKTAKTDEITQESFFLLEQNENFSNSQMISADIFARNYAKNYKNSIMCDISSDFLLEDSDFETLIKWFDIKKYQKLKLHLLYKTSLEKRSTLSQFREKLEGNKPYIVFFGTQNRENRIYGGFRGLSQQEFAFEIKKRLRIDYFSKESAEDPRVLLSFGETFTVFAEESAFFAVGSVLAEESEQQRLKVNEIEVFRILIDSEMEI